MKDAMEKMYEEAGIEYSKGLERFMGNDALYQKFLTKFLYDESFEEFCQRVEAGDLVMAEKAVHTLKGPAGNLSMMDLYQLADQTVKAIRAGQKADDLRPLVKELRDAYEKVCDAIRTHNQA